MMHPDEQHAIEAELSAEQASNSTISPGRYETQHHFFGKGVRGTFAHYSQVTHIPTNTVKHWLRVELSVNGQQDNKISLRINELGVLAGMLAAIRRQMPKFNYKREMPNRAAKYLNIFNTKVQQTGPSTPNNLPYVLNMVEGDFKISCPFSEADAWHLLMTINSVIGAMYSHVDSRLGMHFMNELGLGGVDGPTTT